MKILIIGGGYIGKRCADQWGDEAIISNEHINCTDDVRKILDREKPDAVLNSAGVRGRPNVDWCEDHQIETMLGNTVLPIYIAEACQERNIYLLHIGSGCVFYGDSPHEDKVWREDDYANPEVIYSRSKYATDLVLSTLPDVGIGRIRMPVDRFPSPGNLIDKLASFPKVIDVENSMTILDDMVDVFYQLMKKRASGIFHITNPGTIKHKEIMELYKKYVDPNHTNEWISNEDLVKQGLAKKDRSNNFLTSENLPKVGIEMREIHEAMEDTMKKYAELKKHITEDSGDDNGERLSC